MRIAALCLAIGALPGVAHAQDEASQARLLPLDPVRARFEKSGISYGLTWTGEVFDVTSGGLSRGGSFNGLLEAYTDVDLDKLAGWKGAAIHVNAFYIHGIGPAETHLGSLAPVSSVEALESLRLFELWIEQLLFNDKLRIRAGQIAADEEFIISETAGEFLNGTFGWPGSAAINMLQGGPAFPFAVPGVRVSFSPSDQVTLLAGVFDSLVAPGDADDPQRANPNGTNFRVGDPPLLIGEAQFKYGEHL